MILNPHEMARKDRYKLTTAVVLPRPIAWVSSMDGDGRLNLAPYSFFTVAAITPLTLLFCPQAPADNARKDTLRNVLETKEFVINIVDETTAEAMNKTATGLPFGESEFEHAGLTAAPSSVVQVPRVAEAPISFECRLHDVFTINEEKRGGGFTVFGRVEAIHAREDVYVDSYVQLDKLKPVGRLMGNWYTRVTDLFELIRE